MTNELPVFRETFLLWVFNVKKDERKPLVREHKLLNEEILTIFLDFKTWSEFSTQFLESRYSTYKFDF